MKKIFKYACAAVAATLSFTSCSNEVDMFEKAGKTAKIDLNITNDNAMVTRAPQTATNENWFAKVGTEDWAAASSIIGKTYTPNTYTIVVGNYQSEANALAANNGAGDAYYTKSESVTLVKGTNSISIDCGKAQNSKVTVDWSGTDNVAGLSMNSVEAVQGTRTYTYSANGAAFFSAGVDVVCTIKYTYNGVSKTITKTITAPTAATNYALNIGANENGTITTLTITYDNEMNNGTATSTTIDAATGNEVPTQNS